jgi:hypothetical protein
MEGIEISFASSATVEVRSQVSSSVESLDSLESFIEYWLQEEGWSLTFLPSHDGEERRLIPVRLKFFGVEVAQLQLDLSQIKERYPDGRVISSFVRKIGGEARFEVDETGLDKWFADYGFAVHDTLCEPLGPKESLIPYVLLYAQSDASLVHVTSGAESFVAEALQEFRSELLADGVDLDRLLCVTSCYRTAQTKRGRSPTLVRSAFVRWARNCSF